MNLLLSVVVSSLLLVPPPQDPTRRIHDLANQLPAETAGQLETLAETVERETTAQLAVVTVPTLAGQSVEQYANTLFNEWGIGQQETNNGVLLLVAPNDRQVRIEVGRGLEPLLTDELCGELLDEYVIPPFKSGAMSEGIVNGTEQLAAILRGYPEAAKGVPGSAPAFIRTPRRDATIGLVLLIAAAVIAFFVGRRAVQGGAFSTTKFFFMTVALLVLGSVALMLILRTAKKTNELMALGGTAGAATAGVLGQNFRRYRRYRPRACSKCGTQHILLNEKLDDSKLSEVQKLEEAVGSVDYDVWYCPACLHNDTEAYISYFSGFQVCPKCHGRLFKEEPQRVITSPTKSSAGLAKVDGQCTFCKYKRTRDVVLPRIVESSSSGSRSSSGSWSSGGGGRSSFGGGSSRGGGASRGW